MNRINIVLLILVVTTTLGSRIEQHKKAPATVASFAGKVHGVLTDQYCTAIPKAILKFEANGFSTEDTSDEEGNFKVELPDASYKLTVIVPEPEKMKVKTVGVRRDESGNTHIILRVAGEATCPPCVNDKNELINDYKTIGAGPTAWSGLAMSGLLC